VYERTNSFIRNRDIKRHWDPLSEDYGGGDSLFTAMQNGWKVETISCTQHYFGNRYSRYTMVYHFELRRNGKTMIMPVTANPYISRLIEHSKLQIKDVQSCQEPMVQ